MKPSQTPEILKKIQNQKLSIGLAIEGGGLRGLVSATMLEFFEKLGLKPQVKCLSGTSSGAINGAYFLADDLENLFQLYKKMASRKFIQPLKFPDAMNLDYLFNDQIPHHHPLKFESLQNQGSKFYVTISPVQTGITEALRGDQAKTSHELLKILRASASAPLYTTNKEMISDQIFNDGHIQMAIPYQPLLDEGVDYVVCLMTQKQGYRKKNSLFSKLHQMLALRNYSDEYRQNFARSWKLYNEQLEEIFDHPKILPLQIYEDDFIISKMCTDPREVDQCRESVLKRLQSFI